MRNALIWSLLAAGLAAPLLPAQGQTRGNPPITAITQESGGPIAADRAALHLDHVDLAIEVQPASHSILGTATLKLRTSAPLTQLLIDLDRNLPVSSIRIDGTVLKRDRWSNPDGRLRIALPRPVKAGDIVTAAIAYGGTPHVAVRAPWDDGLVWSTTPGDKQPWVATTAQGYGCDLFWPCLDFPRGEPDLVDLHITVPAGLKAPSNGKLLRVDTLADGRTTWHWRARSPNPYDIALNIGPYQELRTDYRSRFGNSFPLIYWYLPSREAKAKALFAEFAPTVDFYEQMIGPYPWTDEKLGVVETPHLGMEHQTINAYGNNYRKTPSGFDEIFQHELGHEWFGNQMTVANWDDFWLHEGFTQYMQPLYAQWREGDARYAVMMDQFRLAIRNKAPIVSGKIRTEEDVYEEAKGGPGQDIYYKGAWVLHTLRYLIGDAQFFEATRRLVYGRPDPRPGNFKPRFATTAEFITIVQQVTGRDLGWFFDAYLYQAALPDLQVERSGDQLRLRWKTPQDRLFPMPVDFTVDGQPRRATMAGGAETLTVPAGAHIILDPNAHVLRRSDSVEAYQQWASQR
ncbi:MULTISPECIES: M1 family metallopeptidase [unclassified Sphingomonas]|uniref:M1 family metallopeptidase n=3 Tax=unclassified Sphingomonas TaxID=196159 RepID=UPI0002DB2A08|nr:MULTISPECIES: M1 family metallopeptidase [unclassified Sphingomonas]